MRRILPLILLSLCCVSCTAKTPQVAEPASPPPMPQLSEAEMMQKMKEAATPGVDHAKLQPLVGQWRVTTKWWKDPGSKPEVTSGSASHRWILGKRFVAEDYKGKFFGKPFEGSAVLGYDNVTKEYISTWIDTMGTGMMLSRGQYDPLNKSITMAAKYNCPIAGKEMTSRTVTRIIDNNNHVFEMYTPAPDGLEFKMMEVSYKRRR